MVSWEPSCGVALMASSKVEGTGSQGIAPRPRCVTGQLTLLVRMAHPQAPRTSENAIYDKEPQILHRSERTSHCILPRQLDRKSANLTSNFYSTFYPNPSQHHPTQTYTPRRGSSGYPHH